MLPKSPLSEAQSVALRRLIINLEAFQNNRRFIFQNDVAGSSRKQTERNCDFNPNNINLGVLDGRGEGLFLGHQASVYYFSLKSELAF